MSPFRELFVEVAQNLLEAAAIEAKQRKEARDLSHVVKKAYAPSRESQLITALSAGPGERFMANRFGWQEFSIARHHYNHLRVSGRLSCGHFHRVDVDELVLLASAERGEMIHALVEAIEKRLAAKPRLCFCVQREAA